jgi:hypothetical protein
LRENVAHRDSGGVRGFLNRGQIFSMDFFFFFGLTDMMKRHSFIFKCYLENIFTLRVGHVQRLCQFFNWLASGGVSDYS